MGAPSDTVWNKWFLTCTVVALSAAMSSSAQSWSAAGVVKSTGGVTLSGVTVTVKDSAKYSATTNSSGAFVIQSTVGVLSHGAASAFSLKVAGSEMVFRGPMDGVLGVSMVDVGGRTLWRASVTPRDGVARLAVPTGLRHGAAYIRLHLPEGDFVQAVTTGPEGLKVAEHVVAMRSLATTFPVLVFKMTGYNDTTYAMTSASQTGIAVAMSPVVTTSCPFPTTFKWKDYGSAVASPVGNGWVSIKDFTNVMYNGQHLVYASTHDASKYGSMGMTPFTNWSDASKATQNKMNVSVVAPELMYFTPKKQWILSYQWGSAKFNYMTSSDPTKANGWSGGGSLLNEDITKADGAEYGPIDQVPICDATTCYLFYAGDNGHIYRASMPIGNFPGVFSGSKSILQDTKANLFEAVEVYTVKGTGKYLMIVECMGSARYFRAFSATSLGGTWTPISNATGENTPFAGRKNISNPPSWTNDISHGDLVRSADETRTVDPCNLQLLYQGYAASFTGAYDLKPYKLGVLTFEGK
jgi:hypothetical protein